MKPEETLLRLLAAGLAALKPQPASLHADAAPGAADVSVALADAERARLDVFAAVGAVHLGVDANVVKLEDRKRRARSTAATFAAMADEVRKALDKAHVRHVFFKGVVSDPLLFGGRGLRGTSDVDVLVADLAGAVDALSPFAEGVPVELLRPRLMTLKGTRTIPARIFGAKMLIDVQSSWLLAPPFVDDTAGVLARAVIDKRELPRPSLEDYAAYIGGNLVQDRFSGRLKLALDLAQLFLRTDVAWNDVVTRARAWRVGGALWATARFVEERLGVAAPPALHDALTPPLWRRPLLRASMDGARIPGAFTRAFEGDSLFAGAKHFARYVPARILDYLVDER